MQKRDDPVDRVRTMYWFRYLADQIRSSRPRDVHRAIRPLPSTDAHGGTIKNNRFLLYARGDHVPNSTLVRLAATRYPTSGYIMSLVIWEALRQNTPMDEKWAHSLLWQLAPKIQRAVIKPGNVFRDSSHASAILVRWFGFESLAALVVMFRLNLENHNDKETSKEHRAMEAWDYACGIFQVLILIQPEFITNELSNRVFQLFVQRVFSLVPIRWGKRIDLENYDYAKMSSMLRTQISDSGIYLCAPLKREALDRVCRLIEIPLTPVLEAVPGA